jgi:hypothetical protein
MVMAVHEGLVELGRDGFGGRAIAKTCGLANSAELHAELASTPAANLIVLPSERVFDDMSESDRSALSVGQFQRVEIGDPFSSSRPDVGWILLLG